MHRKWLSVLALAVGSLVFTLPVFADPPKVVPGKAKGHKFHGQVVRVDSGLVVVRTSNREEFTVYLRPETRFLLKDKVVRVTDLRVGASIDVDVIVQGDRQFAETVNFVEAVAPPAIPEARKIQGQVVRMDAAHVVLRTSNKEEFTIRFRPQTRFLLNEKVIRVEDLRLGGYVDAVCVMEGNQFFADSVILVEGTAPPAEGTLLEGEIVRVVGEDQVIIRTQERKEVIVYVDPRTTYLIDDRPARIVDLRPGVVIRADVKFHDGKHKGHKIVVPRRK